jgi:hypothetical protein
LLYYQGIEQPHQAYWDFNLKRITIEDIMIKAIYLDPRVKVLAIKLYKEHENLKFC